MLSSCGVVSPVSCPMVQVITMAKSLGSLLSRAEGRLAPLLRLHIHSATQQMARGDLVPVLHRADKKKRDIVKHLLQVKIASHIY